MQIHPAEFGLLDISVLLHNEKHPATARSPAATAGVDQAWAEAESRRNVSLYTEDLDLIHTQDIKVPYRGLWKCPGETPDTRS
jgi:hypothetical protein